MHHRLIKIIKRTWGAVFLVFGLAFMVRYFTQETQHLGRPLNFSLDFIGITALFQMGFWLLASVIWKQIVRSTSGAGISLLDSFAQIAAVSIGKYLPGKVWGMVVRGAHMKSRGANVGDVLVATFHEQYLLLGSALALSTLLGVFLFHERWAWGVIALVIVGVLLGKPVQHFGIRLFFYFWRKAGRTVPENYALAMPTATYLKLFLEFLLLWVLNGCVFASLYFAFFHNPYPASLPLTMILANTVGITAGFLALFAPGGIGVREAVASAILAHGMPLNDAVFLTLIYRLWVVAMEMLSGLAFIASAARLRRSSRTEEI